MMRDVFGRPIGPGSPWNLRRAPTHPVPARAASGHLGVTQRYASKRYEKLRVVGEGVPICVLIEQLLHRGYDMRHDD